MKRAASLLLLLTLPNSPAQTFLLSGALSQVRTGCPVYIAQASLLRAGKFVLAAAEDQSAPRLEMQLGNPTSKPIKTLDMRLRIYYKHSRYQLDADKRDVLFKLPKPFADEAKSKAWSPASIRLPQNVLRIDSVVLVRVDYQDGSTWEPARDDGTNYCRYRLQGDVAKVAK